MLTLTKIAETNSTITLGWTPVPGCIGYRFSAEKQTKFSHTWDATRSSVKFSKGSAWYKVEALGVEETGTYPTEPPSPIGDPIPANGVISAAGTYVGSYTGTLSIQTSAPVVIANATLTNTSGGTLVSCSGAVDLTLDHVRAFGGSGRFLESEGFKRIIVRSCTIENTGGISLIHGALAGTVLITLNRHHNIQRSGQWGQFVQFNEVQNATIEISWNEILNEYDQCNPEDLVNMYKSAHGVVHDNYFQHQSSPGNAANSGTGVMLENGDNLGTAKTDDWDVHDNQFVDTLAAVIIYSGVGGDIQVRNNRCVQDGYLPDSTTRINGGYSGFANLGPTGNIVSGNVCGFVNKDGGRVDWDSRSSTSWTPGNTSLPAPVTRQMELDEWTRWQAKVASAGVTIGA